MVNFCCILLSSFFAFPLCGLHVLGFCFNLALMFSVKLTANATPCSNRWISTFAPGCRDPPHGHGLSQVVGLRPEAPFTFSIGVPSFGSRSVMPRLTLCALVPIRQTIHGSFFIGALYVLLI